MLTHVSNPTVRQWRNVFSTRRVVDQSVLSPWMRPDSVSGLLTRSSWSLGLIAHWRSKSSDTKNPVVYLPDYFCDSALVVIRALHYRIVFYPIEADGLANLSSLRSLSIEIKPDLLVMPHFFGDANRQRVQIREIALLHRAWLIEDCAHSASPNGAIGDTGDFALFSPHKLFSIPFGAVLTVRSQGPSKLDQLQISQFGEPNSWAAQICDAARRTNLSIMSTKYFQSLWLSKRMLQRIGIGRRTRFGREQVGVGGREQLRIVGPKVTFLAKRLILSLADRPKPNVIKRFMLPGFPRFSDLDRFSAIRQQNRTIWDDVVSILSDGKIAPSRNSPTTSIPYLAVYKGDSDSVEMVILELQRYGLPVSIWPNLPPEVLDEPNSHIGSIELRNQCLYLPIHHDIKNRDIKKLLKKIGSKNATSKNEVKVEEVKSREVWEEDLRMIKNTNLLQSWEYGQAKADSERWNIRRLIYKVNSQSVAICQILERKLFGIVGISRISRGPLWLDGTTSAEKSAVLDHISRKFSIFKLRVLSISPEINVGSTPQPCTGLAGLKHLSPFGTESGFIDLTQDLDDLRGSLDSKWRNQLNTSERVGAQTKYTTEIDDFIWFEEMYEMLRSGKGFHGIPSNLFRSIWESFRTTGNAHLLVCVHEFEKVGAILLVTHGNSATYLAGWNGFVGRKINANNLLLWKAVVHLKSMGIIFFDLGGIDNLNTPSIASFKLGMNPETYSTVGEFIKVL